MPRPVTHYAPEHAATKTACGRDIVLFPVPTVVSRKPGPVDCSKCSASKVFQERFPDEGPADLKRRFRL